MHNKKFIYVLVTLSTIFCILFFCLRVLQYKSFFSFEWEDDARVNQVVYNIATSLTPYQTIIQKQLSRPSLLNDHFVPLYYLIALFYKIFPHIYTYYFIMCFLYGFASIIIYLLAKNILKDEKTAFLISLVYLLFPPLHYAALGGMNPRNFVLPLFLFMFYYQNLRKFVPYLIFMILACFSMEDIPVYVFAFGLYQLLKKYPKKWWLSTLTFSGIYFVIAVYMTNVFSRMDNVTNFTSIYTENYNYINLNSVKSIITTVFTDPGYIVQTVFTWSKMRFFVMLMVPVLLLPLFSMELYIGMVIMFFEIGLPEGFFNENAYYAAVMIPFVFVSLIYTLKKIHMYIGRRKSLSVVYLLIIICLFSGMTRNIIGETAWEDDAWPKLYNYECDNRFLDVRNIFDKRLYTMDSKDRIAWEMIKRIPRDASVTVTGDLLPAVSSRRYVYEFAYSHPKSIDGEHYLKDYPNTNVDFILINKTCLIHGMGGGYVRLEEKYLEGEILRMINDFNFHIVEERGNYVLLERQKLASLMN